MSTYGIGCAASTVLHEQFPSGAIRHSACANELRNELSAALSLAGMHARAAKRTTVRRTDRAAKV